MTNPPPFNSAAASGIEPLDVSRAGGQARLMDLHRGPLPDDGTDKSTYSASEGIRDTAAYAHDEAYQAWRGGLPEGLREGADSDYARYRAETGNAFSDAFIAWRQTPENEGL